MFCFLVFCRKCPASCKFIELWHHLYLACQNLAVNDRSHIWSAHCQLQMLFLVIKIMFDMIEEVLLKLRIVPKFQICFLFVSLCCWQNSPLVGLGWKPKQEQGWQQWWICQPLPSRWPPPPHSPHPRSPSSWEDLSSLTPPAFSSAAHPSSPPLSIQGAVACL